MEENPELQMRPEEELMLVELFPNKTGFTTWIGTQMKQEVSEAVINYLRRNANLFAFSPKDSIEIDPKVALHHLNVDPEVRPIK